MMIMGINAYHGDASAVLMHNGSLIAAVEEERFQRVKHWAGFPRESIRYCLDAADISPREIDVFALSRQPGAHRLRKAAFVLRHRPSFGLLKARQRHGRRVCDVAREIATELGLERDHVSRRLRWVEHHQAHLASAYHVSPFDQAAICTLDGFGDFVSTSTAMGRGPTCKVLKRIYFPHSIGLLYLAITQYLGFPAYGEEYKVMGLAAYGTPDYVAALRQLMQLRPGGGFALDLSYFRHWSAGDGMTWDAGEPGLERVYTPRLEECLGPARLPGAPLDERHMAIAASLQQVFEAAVFHVLRDLHRRTRLPQLCLAGGCALNSVMNGKIRAQTPFTDVYIQPAAADNGTALGAALHVWHHLGGQPRRFVMADAFWGPQFHDDDLRVLLSLRSSELQPFILRKVDDAVELCRWTGLRLAQGKVIGWFQGRMEWGARALGNRSILADPRRADMRQLINAKIKARESFRPFGASILEEALDEYFVGAAADAFMTRVYPVRPDKREVIPAVTHVDGSGRLQTVNRQPGSLYRQLLETFAHLTGVPVLLNTSFNAHEPIVHKPAEALDCFLNTRMDGLVLGHYTLEKPLISH